MSIQDLNVLPSDPDITKGTLPNGVTYFLAANGTEKGLVEFALVQKTGKNTEDSLGRAVSIARNAAVELPRFKGRNSREFLAGNGFFASKNAPVTRAGMISVRMMPPCTVSVRCLFPVGRLLSIPPCL